MTPYLRHIGNAIIAVFLRCYGRWNGCTNICIDSKQLGLGVFL